MSAHRRRVTRGLQGGELPAGTLGLLLTGCVTALNTTDCVTHEQQKRLPHGSGAWEIQRGSSALCVWCGPPFQFRQLACGSLAVEGRSSGRLPKGTNPTAKPPPEAAPSSWLLHWREQPGNLHESSVNND